MLLKWDSSALRWRRLWASRRNVEPKSKCCKVFFVRSLKFLGSPKERCNGWGLVGEVVVIDATSCNQECNAAPRIRKNIINVNRNWASERTKTNPMPTNLRPKSEAISIGLAKFQCEPDCATELSTCPFVTPVEANAKYVLTFLTARMNFCGVYLAHCSRVIQLWVIL